MKPSIKRCSFKVEARCAANSTACLRTGRVLRMPRARTRGRGKAFISPEIMISQRPAEAADRAVPGHWEGDLILGLGSSAIGTLVERTTRFTLLLYLPRMAGHGHEARVKNGPALAGHGAEAVRDAISRTIVTLPEQLRRSLTWDQGAEMAQHARLKIEAGVRVYFCDPHSPWQRGTHENTNGLLRQFLNGNRQRKAGRNCARIAPPARRCSDFLGGFAEACQCATRNWRWIKAFPQRKQSAEGGRDAASQTVPAIPHSLALKSSRLAGKSRPSALLEPQVNRPAAECGRARTACRGVELSPHRPSKDQRPRSWRAVSAQSRIPGPLIVERGEHFLRHAQEQHRPHQPMLQRQPSLPSRRTLGSPLRYER